MTISNIQAINKPDISCLYMKIIYLIWFIIECNNVSFNMKIKYVCSIVILIIPRLDEEEEMNFHIYIK